MTQAVPAPWWRALEAVGLDGLSAPELAVALLELAQDRPAFLRVVGAAAGYPRVGLCEVRRPDRAEVERLDSDLPRERAVLLPEDEVGIRAALDAFEVLLVLDPLWHTGDLFYAAWHAQHGIPPEHARRLHTHLAPAVRLAEARDRIRFIPDHLPGSWDPFPVRTTTPVRRAASLLYWADRLRAVAVAGQADVAYCLRDLARAGPELQAPGGVEVVVSAAPQAEQSWAATFDALAEDPAPLVPFLTACDGWRLGIGAPALPDVSLVLLRAQAGRPLLSGIPGKPFPLHRRPVYLVLA